MEEEVDASAALAFVREHGVVLVSAKGPASSLAQAIAGEPIKGSWWAHPRGKQIFAVLQQVYADHDVVVCRLVDDKLTLVHRRLWPALASLEPEIPASRLARVTQEHTARGHHANVETPFTDWMPADAIAAGRAMPREAALAALGPTFVTNRGSRKSHD